MNAVAPDLPRALQPWRGWLGWFDATLAPLVGDMVRRLSELLGPAPSAGRGGMPEADGLGDLRSRGPYERLLATEWLLAEELPDEFLRRAIASEHLFLAPRMRARQLERSVVALFDCGPRALGAARLAHIAAWILLARRAGEHGGSLRWGVLQQPGLLLPADDPEQLATLMRSRSFQPATAAHVAQWRAALDALAESGERETWWIGATGPGQPAAATRDDRLLTLQPTLAGDALQARLVVAGTPRGVALPLPPANECTGLLRGQFRTAAAAATPAASRTLQSARLSLTQGLLMSVPPGHVAVPELGTPSMMVFAVPRPGQVKLARPRRQQWPSRLTPLAGGLHGGAAMAMLAEGDQLHFWQCPGFHLRPRPSRDVLEASAQTARWLPMLRLTHDTRHLACVIDSAQRLVAWQASNGRPANGKPPPQEAAVIDREVRAMVPLGSSHLAFATVYGDGLWLRELDADMRATPLKRRLCPVPNQVLDVAMTVVGHGTRTAQVGSLALAHQLYTGVVWQVFTITALGQPLDAIDGAASHEVALAAGERGLGLVNQRGTNAPALVVLSADRKRLRLATARSHSTLYESATPIERCSVCPIQGRVAVLTRDRRLTVLDPVDRAALLVVAGVADVEREERHDA